MIAVIGPQDKNKYKDFYFVNTTSTSKEEWSRGLSPFFLGPIPLYSNLMAENLENAWQFAKVYPNQVKDDKIIRKYYDWALKGWADKRAHRYPMGRGAIPLFSLWKKQRLSYIEARKEIYMPLYKEAVVKTEAYKKLVEIYKEHRNIVLFDFDGYDYLGMNKNLDEVLNDPKKKMGHAFVLAMLLSEI